MRKLIINGIVADLPDDEVLALTKESNDIFDVQNKRSNLTNTFNLPFSSVNNKIFGSAHDITAVMTTNVILKGGKSQEPIQQEAKTNKRNWYDVQYIQDYDEIITDGHGILKKAPGHYEFTVYWGNISLSDIFNGKTLRDLDLANDKELPGLSNCDHFFDKENIKNDPSTDVRYLICNTQTEGETPTGLDSDNAIDASRLIPFISFDRIIRQIQADNQIKFEGLDFPDENIYLPVADRRTLFVFEKEEEKYRIASMGADIGQITEIYRNIFFDEENEITITEGGVFEIGFNFIIDLIFQRSVIRQRAKFCIAVIGELYQDGTWQEYNDISSAISAINEGDVIGNYTGWNRDSWSTDDFTRTISGYKVVEINEGDKIRWKTFVEIDDDSVSTHARHIVHIYAQPYFYVGFDKKKFGYKFPMAQNMPDIEQIEIIKYLAAYTGSLIDVRGRTVRFKTIEDFIRSVDKAQDISDHVQEFTIDNFHCELGQTNVMRHDNHDDIFKDDGMGVFRIDNNTLDRYNEFYVSPFSASQNQSWRGVNIVRLPVLEEWQSDMEDINPRIVDSAIVPDDVYLDFDDEIESASKERAFWSEGKLGFQSVVNGRYESYVRCMNDYKYVKAKCFLTSSKFHELDLMQPVYIRQAGGYFILNKIHNFVSGQMCELELTALAYAVTPELYEPTLPPPPPPPLYKTLTIIVRENGRVRIDGVDYLTGTHLLQIPTNAERSILPIANTGYHFYKWEGDLTGDTKPEIITMNTDKTITVFFRHAFIKLEDSTGGVLTEDGLYINLET